MTMLFLDWVKGAECGAAIRSPDEITKAEGLELYVYLMHALSMMPYLDQAPAHNKAKAEVLMSWRRERQKMLQ